ncbi:unnamed protein product [Darwinula stevensoni]|uniref:Alpha-amylase C-terminal domain-containing protein n=1 Tax=Darwinula stevensoni TaxID=69355 RepID=A0A7R8XCD4_9CRUS|nr:unnamed protein product [Darwinula stevensoni]CAG0887414.1 unnamed protein product [Darwinula stevensoni]
MDNVEFRNAVVGTDLENFFLEGDDVAFSRGDKGFFAISKSGSMDRVFQTGMPEGTYCNVIDGCETEVTVESDGTARIQITNPEEPILAICQGCTGDGFPRMQ